MPGPIVVQSVATTTAGASDVRLVSTDVGYTIETRETDELGGDRWVTDAAISSTSQLASGASCAALSALLTSYQANLRYFGIGTAGYRFSRREDKIAYVVEQRSTDAIGAERWITVYTIPITTSTGNKTAISQNILAALLTAARS